MGSGLTGGPSIAGPAMPAAGLAAGPGHSRSLTLLHEISRELTSILDREELLKRIAQHVKRVIDYQLFSVMLWNEEREVLEHTCSLRFGQEIEVKTVLRQGEGLCGAAMVERRPVRVANVHSDPRYVQCSFGAGERSELVAPLLLKDRVIGVLDLESTEYNAFSEEDEQMLSTLASYVAIALENSRLYEEVRRSQRRLERELATARTVQAQLLPPSVPTLAGVEIGVGYEPARELGGDFYDFPVYGDGKLAFVAGDVSGKGTAAALHGMLAVGILREHVAGHPCPPAEMLELMNRRLHQPHIDDRFIAMLMGLYDARSRSLVLANAGFPRPWLVRDGHAEAIDVGGVPLGILPDLRYEERQVQLVPGDVIAVCSDGIHEALDGSDAEFGLARLCEVVKDLARTKPAQQIASGILEEIARHSNGRPHAHDDRTVVVLKVSS